MFSLVLPWLFLAWKKNYFPWRPVWLVSCAFFCEFTQLIRRHVRRATEEPKNRQRPDGALAVRTKRSAAQAAATTALPSVPTQLPARARARAARRAAGGRTSRPRSPPCATRSPSSTQRERRRRASRFLLASCVCSATRTVTLAPSTSGRSTSEWADVSASGPWSSVITSPNAAASEQPLSVDHVVHRHLLMRRAERNDCEQRSSRCDCRAARAALA